MENCENKNYYFPSQDNMWISTDLNPFLAVTEDHWLYWCYVMYCCVFCRGFFVLILNPSKIQLFFCPEDPTVVCRDGALPVRTQESGGLHPAQEGGGNERRPEGGGWDGCDAGSRGGLFHQVWGLQLGQNCIKVSFNLSYSIKFQYYITLDLPLMMRMIFLLANLLNNW